MKYQIILAGLHQWNYIIVLSCYMTTSGISEILNILFYYE